MKCLVFSCLLASTYIPGYRGRSTNKLTDPRGFSLDEQRHGGHLHAEMGVVQSMLFAYVHTTPGNSQVTRGDLSIRLRYTVDLVEYLN